MKKIIITLVLLQASLACGMPYGSGSYGMGDYVISTDVIVLEISESWLCPNYDLDFNSDGIVNLEDYAYWVRK